jgi:DNA-directed RNA polymerase subunit N (RpoN/RPB10)
MPGISQCFSFGQNVQQTWEVLLRNVEKRQINESQYETLGGNAPSRHIGRVRCFCAGDFQERWGEPLELPIMALQRGMIMGRAKVVFGNQFWFQLYPTIKR